MMFMQMAEAASRRSTCYRRSVGAILVRKNIAGRLIPISIGYNGPPAGEEHCTGANCPSNSICSRAIHAEINAIRGADGFVLDDPHAPTTMYQTESPCPECAWFIVGAGIKDVYYFHEYRLKEGIDILTAAGIGVFRMTPGGYVINYVTNELVHGST
jgi:dCMP deaminase